MKKIIPIIGIDVSLRAFAEAKLVYNEKLQAEYNNDKIEFEKKYCVKKPIGAQLRYVHYALFFQILNEYAKRIDRLPSGLNEFFPNEILGLWVTRGDLAVKLGINPRTVYGLLKRMQAAGVLIVKNHGDKKPLELRIDKNILIVFDKKKPEFVPDTKFLSVSLADSPFEKGKTLPHKKELLRTINNNTITQSGVSVQELVSFEKNTEDTAVISSVAEAKSTETVFLNLEDSNKELFLQGTQQTEPQSKNLDSWHGQGFAERNIARLAAKKSSAGKVARSLPPIQLRRAENLRSVASEFVSELLRRVFPNRFFTPEYRFTITEYVENNYFGDCETITAVENRYKNNLFIRLEIAESYLKKFKRPDGKPFDTTYFYPMAYLNVENFGNGLFSFRNTSKLLQNNKTYEKLNGYNRKTTPEVRKSLNQTVRALENGRVNYDTAYRRITSLCIEHATDEPMKQFLARVARSGVYGAVKSF